MTIHRKLAPLAALLVLCTASSLRAVEPATHLIQVGVLIGSMTGETDLEALPENARAAVDDIRGFLPFTSYRFLDTAVVRSSTLARTQVNGPDGHRLDVTVTLIPSEDTGRVDVRSFVVDPDILNTAFTAKVNETVVVGSSRLNGGESALVFLFTALPE